MPAGKAGHGGRRVGSGWNGPMSQAAVFREFQQWRKKLRGHSPGPKERGKQEDQTTLQAERTHVQHGVFGKDTTQMQSLVGWNGADDQIRSVAQSCPTPCDPMNHSTPVLPVHHQLPEFTKTHIHRVSDAIQPSHPLSSPSPPAPNPSQHQSLFQ